MIYYVQTNLDNTISNVSKKFKQGYVTIDVPNFWLDRFLNNFNDFWVDSNNVLHKPGTLKPITEITTKALKQELEETNNEIKNIKSGVANDSNAFSNALNSKVDKEAINSVRDTLIAVNSQLASLPNTATKQDLVALRDSVANEYAPLANSLSDLNANLNNKVDVNSLGSYVTKEEHKSDYLSLAENTTNNLSSLDTKKANISDVESTNENLEKINNELASKVNKYYLDSELSKKADSSAVINSFSSHEESLNSLKAEISKAGITNANVLANAVKLLQSEVDDKVSESEFETLSSAVQSKADKSIVESLEGNFVDEISKKVEKDSFNNLSNSVSANALDLNSKANKSDVQSTNDSLSSEISKKVGSDSFNSLSNLVNTNTADLNSKADTMYVNNKLDDVKSSIESDSDSTQKALNDKATTSYVDNKSQILLSSLESLDSRKISNNQLSQAYNTLTDQTDSLLKSKANKADLTQLSNAVNDKNKNLLDRLFSLDNKTADSSSLKSLADNFSLSNSEIRTELAKKVDAENVKSANDTLLNSINQLNNNKVNVEALESVRGNLQDQINTFNDAGSGVVKNVGALQEEIKGKANQHDLDTISSAVDDKIGKAEFDLNLNRKADKYTLDEEVNSLSNNINSKASKDDLDIVKDTVDQFSNKLNLETSNSKNLFNSLSSSADGRIQSLAQSGSSTIAYAYSDLNTKLESESDIVKKYLENLSSSKADKTSLNSVSGSLSDEIDNKLNKDTFTNYSSNVSSTLQSNDLKYIGLIASNASQVNSVSDKQLNDINSLSSDLNSKANKSSVDSLVGKFNTTVSVGNENTSKVSELINIFSKVRDIIKDNNSITTSNITSNANRITNQENKEKEDVASLSNDINHKVEGLQYDLNNYATSSALNTLSSSVNSQLNSKANKSSVESLNTVNSMLASQVNLYTNVLSTINDKIGKVADNPTLYKTKYNQFYHYNIPSGFMNDIQSIIKVDDHWNIYYLSNGDYGNGLLTEWRLVQTRDFKQFTNVGIAIKKNQGGWESVASGSLVFNKQSDGHVINSIYPDNAIIAFFTGYTGGKQIVYQAVSFDDGVTFEPAGNPVSKTPFGDNKTHRDPEIIYNPNNKKMVMYLAEGSGDTGSLIQIYQSIKGDEGTWDYIGTATPSRADFTDGAPGGFECPHIFKDVLDIKNGNKFDIMMFSANSGGNGTSVFYQVGKLDSNYVFKPSGETRRIDYGYDFYASNFAQQKDGSILTIGWIGSWNRPYTDTLKANNNNHLGSFTLPRKLTLNDGWLTNDIIEPSSTKMLSWTATNGLTLKDDSIHSRINAHFNSAVKSNVFTFDYGDGKIIVTIKNNNILIAQPQALLGAPGASSQYFPDGATDIAFYLDNSSLEIYLPQSKRIFTTQMISNNKSVTFNSSNTIDVMDIYNFNKKATLI